ncbi:MAG TPA: GNAT family N-acetyltransferase [Kofleriaceae bacterium]|nr:GNAT family N-acetyltransferase [Kofleriaceae bacterium]
MHGTDDHGAPNADERGALLEIIGHAFLVVPDDCTAWFERAGHENLRVIRRRGEVLGGLVLIPMGQYFGGRSVPMTGIAGVGVRLDAQRRGVATALMRNTVGELAEAGVALSALFASTRSLYRKVGYEAAGGRFLARLTANHIEIDERSLELRRVGDREGDLDLVRAFYREHTAHQAGHLDRGPYVWHRLAGERGGARAYGVLAEDERGALEGYLLYRKVAPAMPLQRIEITDLLAITPRGWRRLWAFVRDLSTRVVEEISFYTAPDDPALLVHPDPRFPVQLSETWLLRVVDARAALVARGYPVGLRAELQLEISDPLLPRNAGRFWLRVADGAAELEPGGAGRLRVDERGLAALYAGFADPITLARLGRLEGEPADLAAAAAVFAGPAPWMREMF